MIGSIIGAGLSAAGSIFGGIKASKAMRQVQENLKNREQRNQSWFDKNYYEDSTQRADAQQLLRKTEEAIRNRNRNAAASAAVTGATQESQALANEANAQAMADAMSQIALAGEQRKDNVERRYQQERDAIEDAQNDLTMKKAQAISQAVQGVTKAAGGIASNF